ncbi:hypothetical protein GUJ93_ZPchr0010g9894 [Zizania palustris]|uniref:Uncharacterized protein n=1 Tax=Zizania palustris TaxID=103762 RepID=A0A8J5SZG0_ZIZPA|nr:hypothetical protein GUJ93_ZPchr0010g9894 [Zizania palustris]
MAARKQKAAWKGTAAQKGDSGVGVEGDGGAGAEAGRRRGCGRGRRRGRGSGMVAQKRDGGAEAGRKRDCCQRLGVHARGEK